MNNLDLTVIDDDVDADTMTATDLDAVLIDWTAKAVAATAKPAPTEAEVAHQRAVEARVAALEVEQAAQRVLAEKATLAAPPMDVGTLREILSRDEQMTWRMSELLPTDGRMMLVAQNKVGKTSVSLNLVRCFITGEPFMGRFDVTPVTGMVAMMNYEVSPVQLATWAQEHGVDPDRLLVINLRGKRNPLATEDGRAELVQVLTANNVEILIVDPFGRAFTGKDQNSASDVAPWLVGLDTLANDAGVSEVILSVHAGLDGSRSRGSSALMDWPDTIVTLTKDTNGSRFFEARGRDVEIERERFEYNAVTRQCLLANDKQHRADATEAKIIDYLRVNADVTSTAMDEWARNTDGVTRDAMRAARTRLIDSGIIIAVKREGRGGGQTFNLTDNS